MVYHICYNMSIKYCFIEHLCCTGSEWRTLDQTYWIIQMESLPQATLEYDSVNSSQSSNHRSHSMNRNPNTALWRFEYRTPEIWIRNRKSYISHKFKTDYCSSMIRPPNWIFLKIQVWIPFLNYSLTSGILFCSWTKLLELSLAFLSLFLIIYL